MRLRRMLKSGTSSLPGKSASSRRRAKPREGTGTTSPAKSNDKRDGSQSIGALSPGPHEAREPAASEPPYFLALDGEGIDGRYVLLSDSDGGELVNLQGIGTLEAFEFLFRRKAETPGAVLIGFGTSYDVNMIFRDIPDDTLREILLPEDKQFVAWEGYEILYFPRKLLKLRRGGAELVWYDVLTFFQSAFVQVVESVLGERHPELEAGKAARGTFNARDFEKIKRYNRLECRLLVRIMETTDALFRREGIQLRKYHGPGAVADFILGKRGENVHVDYPAYKEDDVPVSLWNAWDCAYFGGRIENLVVGSVRDVYSYDINSAYPAAASRLTRCSYEWQWNGKPRHVEDEALYLVEWSIPKSAPIGPFPWRDKQGRIFFPRDGKGWYWGIEINAASKSFPRRIKVLEEWSQGVQEASKLQRLIPDLYARRLALKAKGDPAEYALKIALNSAYGKFAQRIGRAPYRCLPWAGFITAWTRAGLLDAVRGREKDILAFATDGIFSRVPLKGLPLSNQLGEWKEERFQSCLIVMNGFYHLDGKAVKKSATRGVGKAAKLSWDELTASLNESQTISTVQESFVTHTMALHFPNRYGPVRLRFEPVTKVIDPFSCAKRHFKEESISDWSRDHVGSTTVSVNGRLSYPSSLTLTEEFRREKQRENCESEDEETRA